MRAKVEDGMQNMLKVGKVTVGLIGLDNALNWVAESPELSIEDSVSAVFDEIRDRNYIPATAVEDYKEAIRRAILRLKGGEESRDEDLVIRILGPGCVSCNNLQKLVIEVMNDMGIAADIFQVHDPDEIGRFGVLQTPALVVNGRIKCMGRLPSRAQIEECLRDELG